MFKSARVKLTLWYLLIIVIISFCFSILFYNSASKEINRLITKVQVDTNNPKDGDSNIGEHPSLLSIEELEQSKKSLLLQLVFINAVVVIVSGGSGYFLAGRTLKPIKEMVDEQNRFITDSSHELRTPLTAMKLAMEGTLRRKPITDNEARDLIHSNLEEVASLDTLTDRLIQLMQVSTHAKDHLEKISLNDMVRSAEKKVSAVAQANGVAIKKDLEEVTVLANKQSLAELFTILLDNAIKYSQDKGTVMITTRKKDNTVQISIADKGIGIAEEEIPHLFDRFYRSDKARQKTDTSGYGLGLSIAKQIVDTYGGSISVESKLGTGSIFRVTLPTGVKPS